MGRRFGGHERSGMAIIGVGVTRGAVRRRALLGVMTCLCAASAIAGCGENASTSASAPAGTTAATTATTPSTATTSTSTTSSTAAKPAPKSSQPSKTTATTATTPATPPAKTSTEPSKTANKQQTVGRIKVTSTAFKTGGSIGVKYTCDGADVSPPLQWQGVPQGASEVLVLAIDLSGGSADVVQWAIAGIPPTTTSIPEGHLPPGAFAGVNSAGKIGWGGICGGKGQLHRVGFLFYALKHPLGLKAGFNPIAVRNGLKGATMATGLTLTTYQRR